MKIKRKPKVTIRRKKTPGTPVPFEPFRHAYVLLVHSFLYYKLDESIISDDLYDKLAKLVADNLDNVTPDFPCPELLEGLGAEGSMFHIKNYPPYISEAGLRALHYHKTLHGMTTEPFHTFITRYGFSVKGDSLHAKTEDPPHQPTPKRIVRKRRAR